MKASRRNLILAAAALTLAATAQADAPKGTLRVLVGFPPGGATDAIARTVADRLPALLGQTVIVENKPGAGGRVAADAVLAAPADGMTFMIAPNATPTFQMLVFGHQIKWDIERDFTPVATLATYPLGMGVATSTGATDVKSFVAWARANPSKASFGTPGLGGQNHFLGVAFAKAAGIDLPVTPYKGSPPMVTDLVGGHVPAAVSLMDGMMAHHQAGKVRVIGVFTKTRSPLMPDIPTFAEQGVNVTNGEAWTGMWTRAGAPAAQVERVRAAVRTILAMPEVQSVLSQRLKVQPTFRDGAQTAAVQREELAYWGPIIKASGFKPQ